MFAHRAALAISLVILAMGCKKRETREERAKRELAAEAFEAKFRPLMNDQKPSALPQVDGDPYIRGKLLVAWHNNGTLAANLIRSRLPPELVANEPGEVGTVAHAACRDVPMGQYTDGSPAFGQECGMFVVDLDGPKRIAHQKFTAKPPEKIRRERGEAADEVSMAVPYEEMADFLKALPRR